MNKQENYGIYLLTGKPRVGKSTAIKKIIETVGVELCGGFYTEEIRIQENRMGFRLVTLDGQEEIMAYKGLASNTTVGSYGINLACLDELGVNTIYKAIATKKLIIIDEIGPMEAHSQKFRQATMNALDCPKPVLGTIALRSDPWLDTVKSHASVHLYELTPNNRDLIMGCLIDLLRPLNCPA